MFSALHGEEHDGLYGIIALRVVLHEEVCGAGILQHIR
jgi:hypothetical protein